MKKIEIMQDAYGSKVVVIPDIIFANKQNIDWNEVELYLEQYVGENVVVAASGDMIYLGTDFPDEFAGSRYTRKTKGARAKAKANAAQGVRELITIATDKTFRENHKEKHSTDAGNGWYYYTTRFALPVYENERKTEQYNVYTGCLVVNCTLGGKMYLYDLVDIKKEASNPLKTI
ncbi:MAG: hypothetical protein HFH75_07410 [Lachnospiraceae bacterium]|jgi:hypothetical protein|nr:hypothetical protein [Lachnospiraceae bacterium]MDE6921867.1 hypothetical protein [Lachnospiraceae bacterium]MDE6940550.1 hypothetical protein [Lachnospiraceae bacterium]MDE6989153.1 hypothetical protein [Lachnospiraceae bacterium]